MAFQEENQPVLKNSDSDMSVGFKLLLWLITINMLLSAVCVWSMAVYAIVRIRAGIWLPITEFRVLMVGFHIILLAVSVIGWYLQVLWHRTGEMVLYPCAMVIGSLMLDVAAYKMAVLLFL